jgi:uncharacterized protein
MAERADTYPSRPLPTRSATSTAPSPASAAGSRATEAVAQIRQHSLLASIALHLFPGALLFAFILAAASVGVEPVVGLLAGIVLVITPLELGVLLLVAKRETGRWAIGPILAYREPLPARQIARLAVPLVLWVAAVALVSMALLDRLIVDALFFWYPEAVRQFGANEGIATPPIWALVAFFAAAFPINGVLGPVVEELYFRGYLLPRISRLGRGAAVLNAVLFSLYHFWTPWQNLARVVGLVPWLMTVQRKRSLRLSMVVHISVNIIFLLVMLVVLLAAN